LFSERRIQQERERVDTILKMSSPNGTINHSASLDLDGGSHASIGRSIESKLTKDVSDNTSNNNEQQKTDNAIRSNLDEGADANFHNDDVKEGRDESKPSVDVAMAADDGRQLSEYEILRLERIKRNREYLAKLGLDNPADVATEPDKKRSKIGRPKRETSAVDIIERRTSISRRTKMKPVSYVEPSVSVRDILRTIEGKVKDASGDKSTVTHTVDASAEQEPQPNVRKPTDYDTRLPRITKKEHRMESYIWAEFRRLKSIKSSTLKKAERALRLAEKEVKYWRNRFTIWERRNERRLEAERQRQNEVLQKQQFGGKTMRELLSEMDQRMPIMLQAVEQYDNAIMVRV
jgi:hypothetical protein